MSGFIRKLKSNQVIALGAIVMLGLVMVFIVYPEYQDYRMKKQMAAFFSVDDDAETTTAVKSK